MERALETRRRWLRRPVAVAAAAGVALAGALVPVVAAQAADTTIDSVITATTLEASYSSENGGAIVLGPDTDTIELGLPDDLIELDGDLRFAVIGTSNTSFVLPLALVPGSGADRTITVNAAAIHASGIGRFGGSSYKLLITNYAFSTPGSLWSDSPDDDQAVLEVELELDAGSAATSVSRDLGVAFADDYAQHTIIVPTGEEPVVFSVGDRITINSPLGDDWSAGPRGDFSGFSNDGGILAGTTSGYQILNPSAVVYSGSAVTVTVPTLNSSLRSRSELVLVLFASSEVSPGAGQRVQTFSVGVPLLKSGVWSKKPAPTITAPKVGAPVTVKHGTWSPLPQNREFQWKLNNEPIPSATDESYTPEVADLGKKLSVTVTAKRAGYSDVVLSSKQTTIGAGAFTAAPVPTLSDDTAVGSTLTADAGAWEPAATLAYAWLRDGKPIAGQTAEYYTLVAADRGKAIQVRVTGSAPGYATTAKTSAKTAKIGYGVLMGGALLIDSSEGTSVGSTLSADFTPPLPEPDSVKYQWFVNGAAVKGATGPTFVIPGSAIFGQVTLQATATKSGYNARSYGVFPGVYNIGPGGSSAPTVVFSAASPQVGKALKATLSGVPAGAKVSYQWRLNGAPVTGATGSSFTPTAAQHLLSLDLGIVVTRLGHTTNVSVASAGTVLGSYTAPAPKITRSADTLIAVVGVWNPLPAPDLEYVWQKNGVVFGGDSPTATATGKGKYTVRVSVPSDGQYAAHTVVSKVFTIK